MTRGKRTPLSWSDAVSISVSNNAMRSPLQCKHRWWAWKYARNSETHLTMSHSYIFERSWHAISINSAIRFVQKSTSNYGNTLQLTMRLHSTLKYMLSRCKWCVQPPAPKSCLPNIWNADWLGSKLSPWQKRRCFRCSQRQQIILHWIIPWNPTGFANLWHVADRDQNALMSSSTSADEFEVRLHVCCVMIERAPHYQLWFLLNRNT